jgi:hypothetical protein
MIPYQKGSSAISQYAGEGFSTHCGNSATGATK